MTKIALAAIASSAVTALLMFSVYGHATQVVPICSALPPLRGNDTQAMMRWITDVTAQYNQCAGRNH